MKEYIIKGFTINDELLKNQGKGNYFEELLARIKDISSSEGAIPSYQETEIAKNYLTEEEINILNRMVSAYLELAELQALNRKPMYMKDWINRLDDFIKMTGNEILSHSGKVSHLDAIDKAKIEYSKFQEQQNNELSRVEKDFIKHLEESEKLLKK